MPDCSVQSVLKIIALHMLNFTNPVFIPFTSTLRHS